MNPAKIESRVELGQCAALLQRVASDDSFRAQLQADPTALLSSFGIDYDSDSIPEQVTLPSSESLLSCLDDDEQPMRRWRWTGILGGGGDELHAVS